MTSRRLLPRVLFLTAVLALFFTGGFLAWIQSWRTGEMLDLETRSEVVELPSGKMEFAVRGEGPPVLVFHSAPGGYDQGLALAGFLPDAGFQIIAPSRPGYLRTPLAVGASPEAQAVVAAELLDHLDISKTSIIGFGWGGSAAIEFAKRFADRTSSLTLVSSPTLETPAANGLPLPLSILNQIGGNLGSRMLKVRVEQKPAEVLGQAFDLTSSGDDTARAAWVDFLLKNPGDLERFQETILSLSPLAPREEGLENDLQQPLASIRELTPPVLLVHGSMDKAVPPASRAASPLAPAELFPVPGEGHLVLSGRGASSAAKRIVDFVNLHQTANQHGQ
ncbi:MAG: alpha/beta fold hydrolase [Terrimicrobiaceae bacterium]